MFRQALECKLAAQTRVLLTFLRAIDFACSDDDETTLLQIVKPTLFKLAARYEAKTPKHCHVLLKC